eukprot:TRINITY_DN2802_c0_g3_i1.p1 TRINITY_DN2802_c0_g3~~TRINITY_DN2802_c0_g3_i1.p1  ORF type:complete len:283 (-),score=45.62 TRINITY_DN2802_c0_g3_i1:235-1083(-)
MQSQPFEVPLAVRVYERSFLLDQLRSALQVLIFSVLEVSNDNSPLFNHTLGVGPLLRSINAILSHGRKSYDTEAKKHFTSLWDNFGHWFHSNSLISVDSSVITSDDLYVLRTLPHVESDDIRSLATIAVLLNRHTLHLFLENLLKDQFWTGAYYETYSVMYDAECKSVLLLLLKGLNSLNFKLSIVDIPKIANNVTHTSALEEIESIFIDPKNQQHTLHTSSTHNDATQNIEFENYENISDLSEDKPNHSTQENTLQNSVSTSQQSTGNSKFHLIQRTQQPI